MAVGVGFEPTEPLGSTVFKTAAFDHSASPPNFNKGEFPPPPRLGTTDSVICKGESDPFCKDV